MRVSEGYQSLCFAQASLSGDKDALRNPALAVAKNVMTNAITKIFMDLFK
jgi:hypothetical protein